MYNQLIPMARLQELQILAANTKSIRKLIEA